MIVAYLRVSTGHQVLDNQKNEIEKYAKSKALKIDRYVMEVVSGKTRGRDRKLGKLIRELNKGDMLIVTEISRLSRTLMDIMSIVGDLLRKDVSLYSIKDGYTFDDTINSKVLLFAFGLVAEIERNLISMRTKEALELRKRQGIKLGRKEGSFRKRNILEENWKRIDDAIEKGCSIASICRKYKVSYSTWYRYRQDSGEKIRQRTGSRDAQFTATLGPGAM